MTNKILNIVAVLEEGKLACIEDRKVPCFDCSFSCWRNCRLSLCPSNSNPIPVPINPDAACEAACIPNSAANVGINLSFKFSCFFKKQVVFT